MGWIKNRIDSEYRKHKKLDWSRLAEAKISSTIKDIIEEIKREELKFVDDTCKKLVCDVILSKINGNIKECKR